ncbi:hypothetical protein HHI36_010973 [Cryptolaemus montrouzieri]|uniref:Uncharacterized protein n=1 Tax=Cryptolaemus montrouzieri TaxID=559131 RepID=A0ABD2MKG4_9CUCU
MTDVHPKDEGMMKRLPAEIGEFLTRTDLQKALGYFDEAVHTLPDDRFSLLRRASARKRALNIPGAARDIQTVLKLDADDLRAHALNNDIIYLKKNFEKALILNNNFLKKRRCPDDFHIGYMKCMDAIQNSIVRERAGHPLRDHYKVIRKKAWERAIQSGVKKDENHRKRQSSFFMPLLPDDTKKISITKTDSDQIAEAQTLGSPSQTSTEILSRIMDPPAIQETPKNIDLHKSIVQKLATFPYQPLQPRTTNILNYLSERYLGQLYKDKNFLTDILSSRGLVAPNRKTEEKLRRLVDRGFKYLMRVQAQMRSRRPFYHIKFQDRKMTTSVKAQREIIFSKRQEEIKQIFGKNLQRLRAAYAAKDLNKLISLVESLVKFYGISPRSIVTEEYDNIVEAFNLLRDGYFYFGLFSPKMTTEDKIKRVKVRLGIRMEKPPSRDSFAENLKRYNPVNWSIKLKANEGRLQKVFFPEEHIYFNYEMARCNLQLNKPEFVRIYTRRCIVAARDLKETKWVINARLQLAKANLRQNNKIDALRVLEKSLILAKTMNCNALVEFLSVALTVVRGIDISMYSKPAQIIQKREKDIISLLQESEKNKRDAEIIFKKMSYCPTERTLSLLPGVKLSTDDTITRRRSTAPETMKYSKRGVGFHALIKDYIDESEM